MSVAEPLQKMKTWVKDPELRQQLFAGDFMGLLVLYLENDNHEVVQGGLEVLQIMAEIPEYCERLRNLLGLMESIEKVIDHPVSDFREMARNIYDLLHAHAPLKDTSNLPRPPTDMQQKSGPNGAGKKDGSQRRRRNSFFVGGVGKSKVVILQIRGLHAKDDVDICRNCLINVKGVISIIIDFNKKRATLRVRPELKPELLAKSIARTMTMAAEQVVKDDEGNEVLLSFGSNALSVNKENENMPDYPEEESPVLGYKNMASMGGVPHSKKWNFVKSVGDFLSNSFYW